MDLPVVMDQVLRILEDSIPDDVAHQHIMNSLHLVSQDILSLKMEELPEISKDLTHITCFIGIPNGLSHLSLCSLSLFASLSDDSVGEVCLGKFPQT